MEDEKKISLVEHLEELRGRIIKSLIAVIAGAVITYSQIERILPFITKPVGKLIFIAPQEAFMAYVYIALFGGVILSSPVILFQIWRFVSCGLVSNERKWLLIFGPLSFLFFAAGAAFAYSLIAPIGLRFLLGFATDMLTPMITISRYIVFMGTVVLAFGVAFELPIAVLFLTKIGLVSPAFLVTKRRHMVAGIFILSAVLTPPDVVTQLLLAFPLMGLFELSVLFSRLVHKEKVG